MLISILQMVTRNAKHPPLMNPFSLTRAAPFKEQKYWRSPSQSIGNNFSPSAADIPLNKLHRVSDLSQIVNVRIQCGGASDKCGPSRPASPEQQIVEMKTLEADRVAARGLPSERDLERYTYYINNGIPDDMLAAPPDKLWRKLEEYTPSKLTAVWPTLTKQLRDEVHEDYNHALRKAIVDYILLDPEERKRLFIQWLPVPYPSYVVRAPVPWHEKRRHAFNFCQQSLFTPCALTLAIQKIWQDKFAQLRFVQADSIRALDEPLEPSRFESIITSQCTKTRELLRSDWIPKCASAFIELRHTWSHLLPAHPSESMEAVRAFFGCIAALMSKQLRSIVDQSLKDLLDLLQEHQGLKSDYLNFRLQILIIATTYDIPTVSIFVFSPLQDGNSFEEPYDELKFLRRTLLLIHLRVADPKIVFSPTFRETRDCLLRCFQAITDAAEGLPRVSFLVFWFSNNNFQ
ncbi:dynein heavy chain, axonemal [Paragonimus westermani]|uniref:Dynein heavy chain, axonemal n=1 Tax=Paragonimus westermani TaxID=34504 RepID=A0A5J4NNJ6_9TREM|nr:dynein heavy chain, axonemal [Paragonimus westermani]